MKSFSSLLSLMQSVPLLAPQYEALEALSRRSAASEVFLSVIGQFKRGKSSLINALLGEPLLPVGIIPLTTVVTEIRFGTVFSARVVFADGTEQEIAADDLRTYCTEQENPGNCKAVRALKIETPRHPFGPGIVLTDTPGVGSIHRNDTKTAYEHVAQSDAVLFLLSVDSPISQTEHDFLLAARDYAARFYFVVNKTDTVSAADAQVFQEFCTQVISEALAAPVTLHPVSAATGDGIPALTDLLRQDLHNSRAQLVADSSRRKAALLLTQVRSKVTLALESSDLSTEALQEKLSHLEEIRRELLDFSDGLAGLSRRRTDLLLEEVRTLLDGEAAALREAAQAENQRLYPLYCSLSPRLFHEKMRTGLDAMLAPRLEEMNARGIARLQEGYHALTELLHRKVRQQELYAAGLLEDLFSVRYPLEDQACTVSEADDFFLQIGFQSLPYSELRHCFLSRPAADRRFLQENLQRAWDEIGCNENNMLSNCRYKMQESLRTLCRSMEERLARLTEELETLRVCLQGHLDSARSQRDAGQAQLRAILSAAEAVLPEDGGSLLPCPPSSCPRLTTCPPAGDPNPAGGHA